MASGLTRTEAERLFRKLQETEERRPVSRGRERRTVDEVADSLRRRLAVEGARESYLQICESMQRVHVSSRLGGKPVDSVTVADIETVAAAMLDAGLAPKTVRNIVMFLHSVFEHAIDRGWRTQNPVRRASRPKRRRAGDANPDIQFLGPKASAQELQQLDRSRARGRRRAGAGDRQARPLLAGARPPRPRRRLRRHPLGAAPRHAALDHGELAGGAGQADTSTSTSPWTPCASRLSRVSSVASSASASATYSAS